MLKLLKITVLLGMAVSVSGGLYAQNNYTQAPVSISKDKTRVGGKIYYSHVVQERQTLFSICKAYGVTIDEVCEANPELDLRRNGTKLNSIILIPVKEVSTPVKEETAQEKPAPQDYIVHTVKWYESINDISRKYGVSVERIMQENGLTKKRLKRRQELRIPLGPAVATADTAEAIIRKDSAFTVKPDSSKTEDAEEDVVYARQQDLNAVLLLPLTAGKTAGSNNMDFYSGALLAVEDLANMGINTELSVYDVKQGKIPVTKDRLDDADVVIGPISAKDLETVLDIAGGKTAIVSPLDQRASALTEKHRNLVQAPASYASQYADMADWIRLDFKHGDKIIIVSEQSAVETEMGKIVKELLPESRLEFTEFSYNILENKNVIDRLSEMMTKDGANRVVVASDNEAFVCDAIRNLNTMDHNKFNVVLYSQARIRSYENIDISNLHNLNLHLSSSYIIDYDSQQVKSFLLRYRALYKTEPTQFAYQGYDVTRFFLSAAAEYGKNWRRKLPKMEQVKLLQANYRFKVTGDGYTNQGVRRVIYGPDFSTEIIK